VFGHKQAIDDGPIYPSFGGLAVGKWKTEGTCLVDYNHRYPGGNQHLHWYLGLIECFLLAATCNMGNVKFGVSDPDLVIGCDVVHNV